ncbi:hypothetical protein [Clostridium intestinale]|uniref:hypothetical protein n=1 Tax=Clostridium intestinale TaxID=36845 RepID=UPI001A9BBB86|nr:hypothetical protein [Clostridium intestinale]
MAFGAIGNCLNIHISSKEVVNVSHEERLIHIQVLNRFFIIKIISVILAMI